MATRTNKVKLADLVRPERVSGQAETLNGPVLAQIQGVAKAVLRARREKRAVICFTGAHLIKNGLGPLLADLVQRGLLTLVAGNGATAIHDFELALLGQTSENVPNALPAGAFGMAVRDDYHGRGVGTALMVALIELADNWLNLHRLELEVFVDNEAAIHLYQKFGFVIEGRLADFAFRDGEYADVFVMGRIRAGEDGRQ